MSTSIADPTPESAASFVNGGASVLAELRELAATSPALARRLGWDYLSELGAGNRRDQLAELFAKGEAPDGPHGEMEGLIVGKLFGIPEAHLANPLMKIDPTWRGKTFDQRTGTGFNRLSPLGKYTLRAVAPLYGGLRRIGREVQGYGFTHKLDTAAAEPPPDPPGIRSSAHGFFVGPYAECSVDEPIANSSMFVLPISTASACRSRWTV